MTANSPFKSSRSASSPERARTISPRSSKTVATARRLRSSSSTKSTRGLSTSLSCSGGGSVKGSTGISPTRLFIRLLRGLEWPGGNRRGVARPRDPYANESEQELDVDWLGDIVRGAGVEALLTVALHCLRCHRDQRYVGETGPLPDLAHGFVAVHVRHHDVDQRNVDVGRLFKDQDA